MFGDSSPTESASFRRSDRAVSVSFDGDGDEDTEDGEDVAEGVEDPLEAEEDVEAEVDMAVEPEAAVDDTAPVEAADSSDWAVPSARSSGEESSVVDPDRVVAPGIRLVAVDGDESDSRADRSCSSNVRLAAERESVTSDDAMVSGSRSCSAANELM